MVAPSRAGVQELAGVMEAERLMTWRISSAGRSLSRATEAAGRPFRRHAGQAHVLGQSAARYHGADGVEEDELRRRHRGGGQTVELRIVNAGRELLQIVLHRTEPPSGAMGFVRARNRPWPGFCSSVPPFRTTWPRSRVIHGRPRAAQPS